MDQYYFQSAIDGRTVRVFEGDTGGVYFDDGEIRLSRVLGAEVLRLANEVEKLKERIARYSRNEVKHYYEVVSVFPRGGYHGRVYHFDEAGNQEIEDYRGPERQTVDCALNDATDFLDDNELDAELMS